MAPRIVIVGGGSYQWSPKLLVDVANMPSLAEAEIVIHDIDPAPIPRMVEFVEHIAKLRSVALHATGTTDLGEALDGADHVVVSISTGGFASMRQDLEIPARYGIRQSVGDTVGPGGIIRAQRNIPVLVDIAREMERRCPDAWLLNLTNPMTTLCRAITRETSIKTVGLCHEVTIAQFILSLLLDADFFEVRPSVVGVNHLPFITSLDVGGRDGFALLDEVLDRDLTGEGLMMPFPEGLGHEPPSHGGEWTKADLVAVNQVKFEFFRRFGVLPAAGDRHLVEFFPGFLTESSEWGRQWGVELTPIEERERWQARYIAEFDTMLVSDEVSSMPSGEMVAGFIDSVTRGKRREYPLNIPNTGQCLDLPLDVVVESICTVDDEGVRGRDQLSLPPVLAEFLRRVATSQEMTVDAALSGDRDRVFEAMLADPLAGRMDYSELADMTDEMLQATAQWLPQYAS